MKNNCLCLVFCSLILSACSTGTNTSSNATATVVMSMESQIFTQTGLQPATPNQTTLTVTLTRPNILPQSVISFQSESSSLICNPVTAVYNMPVTTICTATGTSGNSTLNAIINKQVVGAFHYMTGNNLFSQPGDNGDNTCGIRQLLLAKHVLSNAGAVYIGDILPVWLDANTFMAEEYEISSLPPPYQYQVPSIYTYAAVAAESGGPRNLVSNVIKEAETNLGMQAVMVYVWIDKVEPLFGPALLADEVHYISSMGVPIEYINGPMAQSQFEPGYYYMIVINDGNHWIGTTNQITYNSLNLGPVPYDAAQVEDAFAGVIVKYALQ